MADNDEDTLQWLEVDMSLMNKTDHNKKVAGDLAADKVHMVTMRIKIDTGCSELALPTSLVQQLNLDYVNTVQVSSSTNNDVAIDRHGPVLIYWDGQVCDATAYHMPSLDSALLGLKPLLRMKPDFDWQKYSIKRSICSFPNKRYLINFDEVYKVIGTENKIEYFLKEHGVRIYMTNEGGSKMFLIISEIQYDINIDQVAQIVRHLAPSLKSL